MPAPNEITPKQLARLIGTPECPVLIDVCIDEDFQPHSTIIPGARRHPHTCIEDLVPDLTQHKTVVMCYKGLKLSQGAAALLRHHGVFCEVLMGGVTAWRDAGLPMVPFDKIPFQDNGSTLWVTGHRPKIDRIACPWLIRRFIDPYAKFLFVAPTEVLNVAEKFNATPFDVEHCVLTHRGDACSFDTFLEEFDLNIEPLSRLATIIRGADTNRHDLAPECAGLLAVSLGLSRMYKDDLVQLKAGFDIYDALYRWARDAVDETHVWPSVAKA